MTRPAYAVTKWITTEILPSDIHNMNTTTNTLSLIDIVEGIVAIPTVIGKIGEFVSSAYSAFDNCITNTVNDGINKTNEVNNRPAVW